MLIISAEISSAIIRKSPDLNQSSDFYVFFFPFFLDSFQIMLTHCTMSCVVLQPYETDSVIDNPISRAALTGMAMP